MNLQKTSKNIFKYFKGKLKLLLQTYVGFFFVVVCLFVLFLAIKSLKWLRAIPDKTF